MVLPLSHNELAYVIGVMTCFPLVSSIPLSSVPLIRPLSSFVEVGRWWVTFLDFECERLDEEEVSSSNDKKTSSQAMNLNACSAKSTIHHCRYSSDLDPTLRILRIPVTSLVDQRFAKKCLSSSTKNLARAAFMGHDDVNLLG